MTVQVMTPATSANFGCGFDCVGVAYDLMNVFTFKEAKTWTPAGFRGERLLLKGYRAAFSARGLEAPPVDISQETQVPSSRGLGSSATAIVGGLLGANAVLANPLSKEELLEQACAIEGHPDNVAPCLLGGFVASLRTNEGLWTRKMAVADSLRFLLLTPDRELATADARRILPPSVSLADAGFDLSRAFFLEDALAQGDLKVLKVLLEDRWHVPYRQELIPDFAVFAAFAEAHALPFTISGSGSTLLMITTVDDAPRLLEGARAEATSAHWTMRVLTVNREGARTEVRA